MCIKQLKRPLCFFIPFRSCEQLCCSQLSKCGVDNVERLLAPATANFCVRATAILCQPLRFFESFVDAACG